MKMTIKRVSQISGETSAMEINMTKEQLARVDARFDTGELIQEIVPELSAQEREFLMSGMTLAEQEMMFRKP
jgi:hypothetical protein